MTRLMAEVGECSSKLRVVSFGEGKILRWEKGYQEEGLVAQIVTKERQNILR